MIHLFIWRDTGFGLPEPLEEGCARPVEFHIRAEARDRYNFDAALFSASGKVLFANFRAVHRFANLLNKERASDELVSPAGLQAAALIDELLHFAIARYRTEHDERLFARVLSQAEAVLGSDAVDTALRSFVTAFPTTLAYRENAPAETYLSGSTEGIPNREIALEELLVCWLSNENRAYDAFKELIDDSSLRKETVYSELIGLFQSDESHEDGSKPTSLLIDLLLLPVKHAPDSLRDQLAYMIDSWGVTLTPILTDRAVRGDDFFEEENRGLAMRWAGRGQNEIEETQPPESHGWGGHEVGVPEYREDPEYEHFSPDLDWMPNVVMMAKNALVWLDQLSTRYGTEIRRLDEIPEAEIVRLSDYGINTLWLIGVWKRSSASRELKRRTGNSEAEASAYSLHDYEIAEELGGSSALTSFRMMCQSHGVRLASDMVPNHTGIDSKWMEEHPDWFIQSEESPFPNYNFSSKSLVERRDLTLQVEDGYYDQSDAAVVFRRYATATDDERFIYHGNDGTGMPWNDTAQLDFANPEVREAVIQTILHVARQFPVIRFDAAMVLTKKHFSRLWYPRPGSGGGIPSRAEHGLTQDAFDARMPVEFWREVVDRVAQEVPDTLLLAEAFWMLEGYFVRTLGMHRVYNSAFMHMLRDEDNAKYRDVMKNTLAFEPEILKRYVNFMSNPDEETAIEQFGDGDKFFGVSLLLVTMPGLPMFAHGQVEGLTERYGMEFGRARQDERPNRHFVDRYEHEIFPLVRKRHLFAEVQNFRMFDFRLPDGETNDNVFVYSNRSGDQQALIVFNNAYESTTGQVHLSTDLGVGPVTPLPAALGLTDLDNRFVTFQNAIDKTEFVIRGRDLIERGLGFALNGYEHRAYLDFSVVDDEDGSLAIVCDRLDGRGIASLALAQTDAVLEPVEIILSEIIETALGEPELAVPATAPATLKILGEDLEKTRTNVDVFDSALRSFATLQELAPENGDDSGSTELGEYDDALAYLQTALPGVLSVFVGAELLRFLKLMTVVDPDRLVHNILLRTGISTIATVETDVALSQAFLDKSGPLTLRTVIDETRFGQALLVHEFDGVTYYNKERFERCVAALFVLSVLQIVDEDKEDEELLESGIQEDFARVNSLLDAHEASKYRWDEMRILASKLEQ